jgi:hypothetical protein
MATRLMVYLRTADMLALLQGGRLECQHETHSGREASGGWRWVPVPIENAARVVHVEHEHASDYILVTLEWDREVDGLPVWRSGVPLSADATVTRPAVEAEPLTMPRRIIRGDDDDRN